MAEPTERPACSSSNLKIAGRPLNRLRVQALQTFLTTQIVSEVDQSVVMSLVIDALDRYRRGAAADNVIGLKTKSDRIAKLADKLLREIQREEDLTREVWRRSSAPNDAPPDEKATQVYTERLQQIREWNKEVGSVSAFCWQLERIIQGTKRTLKELSPKHRPSNRHKIGLGHELAMLWGFATHSNPTPSNSGDFDAPGTAFGWFVKRSLELLQEDEVFAVGFNDFVAKALKKVEADWWVKCRQN